MRLIQKVWLLLASVQYFESFLGWNYLGGVGQGGVVPDEIVWAISLGLSSLGEIVWDWSGVELCGVEGLFWGELFGFRQNSGVELIVWK